MPLLAACGGTTRWRRCSAWKARASSSNVACPIPNSGSLSEAGPGAGSLADRPLASLMRYCEEYVLTCRLEVRRGEDQAVISYRRGEIISATVGDAEGSERLPEVLAWTEGSYEISLPAPVLPRGAQAPQHASDGGDNGGDGGGRPSAGRHDPGQNSHCPRAGCPVAPHAAPGKPAGAKAARAGASQPSHAENFRAAARRGDDAETGGSATTGNARAKTGRFAAS
jgi:hypothetical protein